MRSTQNTITSSRMSARMAILAGETDRMSPIKRLLNLVKLWPSRVEMKMPRATAVEEKTPMTVSLAIRVRLCTQVKSRAKTTASATAHQVASTRPQRVPMATPVKAECPRASEKKAMRFSTTMVDSSPKRGEMTRMASRAFFMKYILPGSAHWKGSRSMRAYQSVTVRHRLSVWDGKRESEIPAMPALPLACPFAAPFVSAR